MSRRRIYRTAISSLKSQLSRLKVRLKPLNSRQQGHKNRSVYLQSGGMVDAVLNQGLPAPIDLQLSGSDIEAV